MHIPYIINFWKLKAKILGKEKLNPWDLYAPLELEEKEIPFEEGLNMFYSVIKDFDSEFYNFSKGMFEQGRVDVFPKKGKRGGAFASYEKDVPSFVLLNYTNKLKDVSTLAHELGHATHGYLSQKQKGQVFDSPLSLAETASIFNELLLSEKLKESLSEKELMAFLAEQLDDFFGTIFRQVQYVLFEKRVHETILDGKELSYLDFNKMWREESIKLTGDSVKYDSKAEEEVNWSRIPHIFRYPFYCYAYAFGNLLSFSLYEQYKEEGDSFVEKYKNILRAGGSKTPYELLKENGFRYKVKRLL